MDKATFDKYLTERYYDQMNYYNERSKTKRNWYKGFQWVLIVLSALAPVLAALNGKYDTNIFVVVISSVVAILTTGLKTFDYQELWVKYRSTYEKLKPEIHYYDFNIGPYAAKDINKESIFVTRIERILDTEHSQWPPVRNIQEGKSKDQKAVSVNNEAAQVGTENGAAGE